MSDLATALIFGGPLVFGLACVGIVAAYICHRLDALEAESEVTRGEVVDLGQSLTEMQARYRAQAPARRNQPTPRTSADPRLRVVRDELTAVMDATEERR